MTLINNKTQFPEYIDIMRQLRPSVTSEAIISLASWRYHFVTALDHNKVVGVGAYFPTASLIRGSYHYLADLVVDSNYRSKGIGISMMEDILSSNLPCELDSGLQRVDAHRFYYKLGFDATGYTIRLKSDAFEFVSNMPQQPTYLIEGIHHLQKDENQLKCIQAVVDTYAAFKTSSCLNLSLFLKNNPNHHLLILQGNTGELEGILLFELQNRLSVGGHCWHVSDLVIKNGLEAKERQNSLLLSLIQYAKKYNMNHRTSPIQSIIVEMTEQEARSHELLTDNRGSNSINKPNISSFFSVTAKHFIKTAPPKDQ